MTDQQIRDTVAAMRGLSDRERAKLLTGSLAGNTYARAALYGVMKRRQRGGAAHRAHAAAAVDASS